MEATQNPDLISVRDFAGIVGLSAQRVYQLLEAGRGPERVDTGRPAGRFAGPRYLIKLNEGLRWAEERQREMPASHRGAAQRARAWWSARKRGKQHSRELAQTQVAADH